MAANVISFGATVGVSAIVFNYVFDFPGADPSIPLYAFVFLVALGIDYSIFLMTRVREESIERGTRPGILVGLAVTGGVITSAGIVLAATFSALAVLPILFLVQIAFMGRVRRAAGHHGRPLAAGPGPVLRHRPQRLVAQQARKATHPLTPHLRSSGPSWRGVSSFIRPMLPTVPGSEPREPTSHETRRPAGRGTACRYGKKFLRHRRPDAVAASSVRLATASLAYTGRGGSSRCRGS